MNYCVASFLMVFTIRCARPGARPTSVATHPLPAPPVRSQLPPPSGRPDGGVEGTHCALLFPASARVLVADLSAAADSSPLFLDVFGEPLPRFSPSPASQPLASKSFC